MNVTTLCPFLGSAGYCFTRIANFPVCNSFAIAAAIQPCPLIESYSFAQAAVPFGYKNLC